MTLHRAPPGSAASALRQTLPVAVLATRLTTRRAVPPTGCDCVRLVVVNAGSVLPSGEPKLRPLTVGDIVLIAPVVRFGYLPEGEAVVTTVFIDTDYLIEHLYWQHLELLSDRDAARDLAARLYPEPVQILRLGELESDRLVPTLDGLVALTGDHRASSNYFRIHALLLTLLAAIAPHIHTAPVELPPLTPRQRAARVAGPRWRAFRPVRPEIAHAAALMRRDIARRWPLSELATHACLSTSQLNRVFKASFGVTPLTYLSILRVQEMARLIRETDASIGTITEQVGWHRHCGHATLVFRRY
ncbi:helix-turn-helix transcriptional regulator, partial [Salmonella enterica subsp. enterica serovar Typhimurium]|nr:helix-turn-helix transcriptional regulator [Salmonella enterica subsp. enterica serovar Typhimurium]EED6097958.1 helix-turn-helix transcriptional regulator [Salmonella enterica subsp. enterica serovar Typhimurium]